jgi:localization factor PodJL
MAPGGIGRRTALHGGWAVVLSMMSPALAQTPGTSEPRTQDQTPQGPAQTQTNSDLQDALRAYSQRNYAAALRLWGIHAQRGDPVAQYNLGRMYARGEGVNRDLSEAYKWFTLSAAAGRREGEQARQAISRSMTPVQMAEGLRRAEAWRRQRQR